MVVFESTRFNFCLFPLMMCSDKYLETLKELPYMLVIFPLELFLCAGNVAGVKEKLLGLYIPLIFIHQESILVW